MKRFQFWAGFFCGVVLLGGVITAADAASGVIAALSSQPIFVDGQRVSMTAYAINGNNYVRLRDIGKDVDFGVTYDAVTNSVYIDSDAPYQVEISQQIQPSPSTVTEESVKAVLAELRAKYPNGAVYPSPCSSTSGGPYGTYASNCAGWALLCSDASFDNLPWCRVDRPGWKQIRPGDLVEYRSATSYHVVMVLERTDEYIEVTESGTNSKVRWGGQYFRWWLESQPTYVLYTRYPS